MKSIHDVIFVNAFSIQMLNHENEEKFHINIEEVSPEEIIEHFYISDATWSSAIGHADTANITENILNSKNIHNVSLPEMFNRGFAKLYRTTMLYVVQVVGGRLPEGSTTLPEGVEMKFFRVTERMNNNDNI